MFEGIVSLTIAIAGSIVAGLIAFSRLEGRLNHLEKSNDRTQKDVDELRIKHETLDSKAVTELTQIKITLAKIEGYLASIKGARNED